MGGRGALGVGRNAGVAKSTEVARSNGITGAMGKHDVQRGSGEARGHWGSEADGTTGIRGHKEKGYK